MNNIPPGFFVFGHALIALFEGTVEDLAWILLFFAMILAHVFAGLMLVRSLTLARRIGPRAAVWVVPAVLCAVLWVPLIPKKDFQIANGPVIAVISMMTIGFTWAWFRQMLSERRELHPS